MLRFLILCCLYCAVLPAMAMMALVTEQELVATSDVAVVGTVKEDVMLPNVPAAFGGQATITVQRVLRGPQVESVVVRHAVPPPMNNGMIIMDHGGFNLQPGQQQVFFLSRGRDGYTITGGFQGMKKPEEADRFAKSLAEPAITAVFAQPLRPIFFGQEFEVKVTVKNATASAFTVYQPRLLGFYYSTLLDPWLAVNPPMVNDKQPTWTVKPGEELAIAQKFTYAAPASWKAFAPESYMLTPAAVRAQLFVQPATPQAMGYPIVTPWQTVLVGYAPPAEARK